MCAIKAAAIPDVIPIGPVHILRWTRYIIDRLYYCWSGDVLHIAAARANPLGVMITGRRIQIVLDNLSR